MYQKQAYSDDKGGCGQMGRGRFGGPWGRKGWGNFWQRAGFGQPPINIEETDAEFVISLFAAGLVKDNVALTVKNDVLTISYPGQEAASAPAGNVTYQEYQLRGFERQFQLNNKVVVAGITASYADGILKVVLPKNPETNPPAQSIPVA